MPSNDVAPQPLDAPNGILDNEDSSMDPSFAAEVQKKYIEERDKRLRKDGLDQFAPLEQRFQDYAQDIWDDQKVESNGHSEPSMPMTDGSSCFVLLVGGGFGGLCAAVQLVKAGVPVEHICIVESAAGFGGTWYWNRYPGLMCDVESYVYMPLLEEMGWMPKHKYSYGPELREYAEAIADKWNLRSRAMLRTKVSSMSWNNEAKQWDVQMLHKETPISIRATFVVPSVGILSTPQFPLLEGINDFKGHMFHTSRWDYGYTGGSPSDPSLQNLQDKRVGIIGTGATAVQCIPHLANWSKHLTIFQRTPSAVDRRDQRATNPETWNTDIAKKNGWQFARQNNFHKFVFNAATQDDPNLVDDEWTRMPSYSILVGGPNRFKRPIEEENEDLKKLDMQRQGRIRQRVDETVKDKATAESLKAWYESFCKRPCFHDDFLPVFNRSNVTLVDTRGGGIDRITGDGIEFNNKAYDLDLIICATGFTSPFVSLSKRSNLTITGREGETLDESWLQQGVHSLHGVMTRGFPNLCLLGPLHAANSVNFLFGVNQLGQHAAYIISKCYNDHAKMGQDPTSTGLQIEPSEEIEEKWGDTIASMAAMRAPLAGCTPGYLNMEGAGAYLSEEEMNKLARSGTYGLGIDNYLEILDQWRKKGDMHGLEVTVK